MERNVGEVGMDGGANQESASAITVSDADFVTDLAENGVEEQSVTSRIVEGEAFSHKLELPASAAQMMVQDVRGDVIVIRVDGNQALLSAGDVLEIGDVVLSGDRGSFDVAARDGSSTTFSANSRLVLEPAGNGDGSSARFFVIQGEFMLRPGEGAGDAVQQEIRTPVATISTRGGRVVGRAALEAQSNSFVLLPGQTGVVGVVSVATAAGVVVLDKAFAGAEVLSTVREPVPFDQSDSEQVLAEFSQDILARIDVVSDPAAPRDDGIFDSLKNLLGFGETPSTSPVAEAEIVGAGDDVVVGQVEDDQLIEGNDDLNRLDLDGNDGDVVQTVVIPDQGEVLVVGGNGLNDKLILTGRDDVANNANIIADGTDVLAQFDTGGSVRLRQFEELELNLGAEGENIVIGDLTQTDIADNTVIIDAAAGDDLVNAADTGKSLHLTGGTGADTLLASSSDDTLFGGEGADVLRGGGAVDAADSLFGGAGLDTLDGGGGDDLIDGGDGVDTVEFNSATSGVNVNLADGTATGQGADTLVSIENATGTAQGDTLTGDAGDNLLTAGAGADVLNYRLGDGNDTLGGGADNDTLNVELVDGSGGLQLVTDGLNINVSDGQQGSATGRVTDIENISATGTNAAENFQVGDLSGAGLTGTVSITALGGNDTLDTSALLANASLVGGAGNDSLRTGVGDDTINGGVGTDTADFTGAAGDVVVDLVAGTVTGHGNDQITGVENIITADGNDQITARADADNNLSSGAGDDTLIANGGNDTFQGGAGTDLLDLSALSSAITLNLDNGTYTSGDIAGTVSGIERVNGGTGADNITGSANAETIAGGEGNDAIDAAGGDDQVLLNIANNGDDIIFGGAGDDTAIALGTDGAAFRLGISADNGALAVDTTLINGGVAGRAALQQFENVSLTGADADDVFAVSDFTGATGLGNGGIVLNGGGGTNALVLQGGTTNLTVDLSQTGNQDIGLGTLSLRNIQNVLGAGGADTLTGDSLANGLLGAGGDDVLSGGDGDDTLTGGAGNDSLIGGDGTDVVDFSQAGITQDTLYDLSVQQVNFEGNDTLVSIEGVIAGAGNDTLVGTNARNFLDGGAGNDLLNSGIGNDVLRASAGVDTLDGGAGTDLLDLSNATAGVNVNLGSGEYSGGGFGASTFSNIEQVSGSSLDDTITGNIVGDTISGLDGNDQLFGGLGGDSMTGGFGDDTLDGGTGADTLFGEQGADSINGDVGDDLLDGGTGDDSLFGGDGNDTLEGQAGSDSLFGGNGDDLLNVTFGKNTLDGGAGNDSLNGTDNQDTLIGGTGEDTLTGGGSADRFAYNAADAGDQARDVITDFASGSDKFQIAAADFGNIASQNGQLIDGRSFVSLGAVGDARGTNEATFIFDQSDNSLHFDPDGDGNQASFEIATVQFSSGNAVQAADFQVG